MDEDERQRKLEAGRAKLASFRQKRAKSVSAGAAKKTSKRKGPTVSKNDGSTQDCHVEPAPPPANDAEPESQTNHNQELQEPERVEPLPTPQQKDQASDLEENLSPVEELREEELLALTGKEQLKQLQQAVEKRNEIIAKLSSNLQDALASRDQVQMEAQSLAGQIQALQKQLQQTSADFLRIKSQPETEVLNTCRRQLPNSNSSSDGDLRHEEVISEVPDSLSCVKDLNFGRDNDMESVLHKLRAEVEEERQKCQSLSAKLTEELEKHQHLLSLLEQEKKGREDERTEKESQLQNLKTQLSQVQSQCLEMQQYKEEKENLNREVLELKKRLEEEGDAERRQREEVATFVLRLQSLEEERRAQDVEMKRLKEEHNEELESVRRLLQEKENEVKFREEEIVELKECKNLQNKVTAGLSYDDDIGAGDDRLETGPDQDCMNVVIPRDLMLEKYLTSVPIAHSQSSLVNESIEHCSQLDISADHSFELNSGVFGEEPLLSISCRPLNDVEDVQHLSSSPCHIPAGDGSDPHWPLNSTCEELDLSKVSEQQTDLEKVLLHQQCDDLQEELALKDRDLDVLREEVVKTTEELEEARSRWAQVTEELRQALWALEEEKERRRQAEEMNLDAHEQDSLQNNTSVQTEKGAKETAEFELEKEVVENISLVSLERDLLGEQEEEEEEEEYKEAVHLSDQTQPELLVSSPQESYGSNQLQTLQEHCENLQYELEETKSKLRAALSTQRTSDVTLQELETTRAQVLNVQAELERLQDDLEKSRIHLDCAEKEKKVLESQVFCLKQNLSNLEEAQAQVVQEKEEHKRKSEEIEERIKQVEQVLEEELEQFENLLKAKDVELAEEKEKWEEEKQEKEKELLEVKHLMDTQRKEKEEELKSLLETQVQAVEEVERKLRSSHQQELRTLVEKHLQEISELNIHLENELLKQRACMEEEQKRQISLIKQVTEREHERVVSELTVKHSEELSRLKTELSQELRESLEAAHEAELQQVKAQKLIELEALRLGLTTDHASQLDRSQANLQQEQESALTRAQASMRQTFAQEKASLQAEHQLELERLRQQDQEQMVTLREQHRRDLDELKQTWETRVAQERASVEEKQVTEIEALRSKWSEEAEAARSDLHTSLSQSQDELSATQTELTNTRASLTEVKKSLCEAESRLQESQTRLEELQIASKKENQKLEEELKQAWADRDAAACSLEVLVSSHEAVLLEKQQQVRHLEEMERQLQQEVLHIQKEKTLLKQSSEEEVSQLWTQLESMRTSRQELGELKEQLLARSSRVDDIERLKADFNKQKRGIKEQNEAELENLRRYFEKRLQAAEESYREEIALLQLRLVEGALEESVVATANDSFILQDENKEENDILSDTSLNPEKHKELIDTLQLQMEEKHSMDLSNLRSSLTVSFEEEVQQVRSDLTDHYYVELQEMKTRHALETEQLKAKLSDGHLRELTRVQAEAARQVEAEIELRLWCHSEELHSRLTVIHNLENRLAALSEQYKAEVQNAQKIKKDFAAELIGLEEALNEEREQVHEMRRLREELQQKHEAEITALRSDLDRGAEERARIEKALSEEKQHVTSLQAALDHRENSQGLTVSHSRGEQEMNNQTEILKLSKGLQEQSEKRTVEKFEKEKQQLEQSLVQKYETSLAELTIKHQNELEHERAKLQKKHADELDALGVKHREQIDSLGASHRDQLTEMTADLESQHNAEIVVLEAALDSKRTADLQSLEVALLKTSRAQLDALEAELTRKHQDETDELEKRLLGNMDTLEATYLKEVQLLRDELMQLEETHQKDLSHQISESQRMLERHLGEQLSIREELRKELAQVHMEKFSAMAAELSHVHKTELAAQKESLDIDHCKALETLKKQVLELEQQHSSALQELTHAFSAEKEHLIREYQLKLQDLRSVSARELEACRRELEEESSRQRQHFVEEAELLKVQSEERLQDKINQLKTEFEDQKEAELEELRRSFTSEQETKEQSYTDKMSQLTTQLQQLDAVVAQLRAEVDCLQGELEGKRAEMETLDTLLQRRERESQEGGNLLKMLTDDLHSAKEERHKLHRANEKLSKVLIDMVRGTVATEELIGQKISAKTVTSQQKSSEESGIKVGDLSAEEQELTQLLCESLLVSDSQVSPEGEEAALSACSRLRNTVCTLLELLNHANAQLEETHDVHLSLEEKFSQGREDSAQLLKQHKLLAEQLEQEAKLKSQLQLELHKAEGLLEGYVAEKVILEESLQLKEAQEERLVEELEDLKKKLRRMESLSGELDSLRQKHQELSEEHSVLLRQKEHLCSDLGEREKALLAETERLAQDRLDLQRQAERDHRSLSQRLRVLERDLEEQETKGLETELHHKTHTEDLNQRVQALEKQLKHERQFIQEQTVEREHERDEFQQEIKRLEAHLRQTSVDNKGDKFEDLALQVESLQAIIKDKMEDHASLLAANQQAQRDVAERNEEIDKMAGRIRELEQALLNSADSNRAISELEQELHKTRLREQELTQDKQALEQQQLSNKLQISALQSKLDETRHCYHDNTRDPTQELRDALDTAQQSLQNKERELETVLGQLENVQSGLSIKETELKHLTLQLELLSNQNAARVNDLQEEIAALKENVSALTLLQEERGEQSEAAETKEETLPSALLQEKNQEIDHLNDEVQRLEQELENIKNNKNLEVELEDVRSQVEHLQSEITRVRQDKEEEEERLHEVISTLQAELATLGPNLHEVSDSQDGDSINPSPARSPEPQQDTVPDQERRRSEPSSLKQELSLIHSASSRSLRSRLKVLQGQLETALAEREGLERLLLTQEEEYRGHGQELGSRLRAEKEKAGELQDLLSLKEAELEEVKVQVEEERNKRKVTEEEKERWKREAEDAASMHKAKAHLNTRLTELQNKELERVREIEMLKTKEQDTKTEINVLRETSLTLERQIQEVRAELVDVEKLVGVKETKIQTLEAANEELSADNEGLRSREQQLRDDAEQLKQEVTSLRGRVQELTVELEEKKSLQDEAQKEMQTHAEVTLAKAEDELIQLKEAHEALRTELKTVKQDLSITAERAEILQKDGQNKDRALLDLETDNQQLKAELQSLQESLAVQEEELAYQQKELQQLQQRHRGQGYKQKDFSHRAFGDIVSVSRDEVSLSSPEVLRRLECSEDRVPEHFHASVLESRLSELSALNSTGLDLPQDKTSPRAVMEPPRSRTLTPDPASHSTHSPRSVSASDNYSVIDSLYTDKAQDLEELDLTTPSSPLGSTSSMSAPEWASDGYGSNVSSELGARLRMELEHTERLDAQFVEYLRCRGMNPTANTDSAAGSMSYSDDLLSPELQGLLKKVYQESCRILTLSQRRPTSSSQSHVLSLSQNRYLSADGPTLMDHQDKTSSNPPMTWQQEKRALQETVIALRELLCRMAQRQTQPCNRSEHEWQRDQLPADAQIESPLKTELEESQKQLKCALDTRQEQHHKIQSLRQAVEEGEEALKSEQTKVQELQQQLEQERDLTVRQHKQGEERKEAMQVSLECQRSEVMALKSEVEQERVISSNLRRELQIEQSRSEMLEKRADDAQREFEDERQRSADQQDVHLKEKTHLQRLLAEAETRLAEIHSKLAEAHNKLVEERDRSSRQVEELSRRHEADAARDRTFISEMRAQVEQERRQGEELATSTNKLRAELLESRRKWEEEDRARREELQREQEAATRCRVAAETLKIQKQEAVHDLEAERKRSKHQGVELAELKERIQVMKDKEREREEQWERERMKGRQEQMERERRQARTHSKLCELELLRQQDQKCMQELHNTLAELQREEKEMAAQRLSGRSGRQHKAASKQHHQNNADDDEAQAGSSPQNQQMPSTSPPSGLLDRLLNENSELTEQVTSLSQERATLKHRLVYLERQLRHSENELAKVTSETENRPISDVTTNHKVQRLYERYLRAESFRKALVYQKRYLLLLLGGFQECEQATLCLIARMGARPSTLLSTQQRPLVRFRSAVRAVIAVSRMKFLTRKWQKAIRRLSVTGSINGHAQAPKVEVLRQQQQQPRSNLDSPPNRETMSALVPPSKSPFRLHNRTYSNSTPTGGAPQDSERSLTEYIHHLEKVQQRLLGTSEVGKTHLAVPTKEERRIQSACSPDMIGYRQRWLQENRTWLYLSCLSPLYLNGPGSSLLHSSRK